MGKRKAGSKKGAKKKYQIEMTSVSLFLWGFCLLFLLAWVFVLGILVGRGFLPGNIAVISDLKSQIAKLEELAGRRELRKKNQAKTRPEGDLELVFYEKLSDKKEEAKKRESAGKRRPGGDKPAEKKDLLAGKGAGEEKTGSSSHSGYKYTVQIASLGELGRARGLIRDMREKGYSAYYSEVSIKGRTYYRIRCGQFDSKRQALDFARELEREAGIKGFVWKVE